MENKENQWIFFDEFENLIVEVNSKDFFKNIEKFEFQLDSECNPAYQN